MTSESPATVVTGQDAWFGVLRCPRCDARLRREESTTVCSVAECRYAIDGGMVDFAGGRALPPRPALGELIRQGAWPEIRRRARYVLDPLTSKWSPIPRYTERKRRAYYERCLADRRLAEEFRKHYLPEALYDAPGRALDLGCGNGRLAALLAQIGWSVYGLDIAPHPYWQRIRNASFGIVRPQGKIPFADGTFDLCVHFEVLSYIDDPEPHLREVARVLRPGGWFSIRVTNRDCHRNRWAGRFGDADHFTLYSEDELVALLEKAGFVVERTWAESFYAPVFPLAVNWVRRVLLPRQIDLFDRDSLLVRLTPPTYRGMLHAVARRD